MNDIKTISIPQACHQSWQQMTAVNEGRHCEHCCKTVVDFTQMSNGEVIAWLSNKTSICGRFEPRQLNDINHMLYTENLPKAGFWKRAVMAMGLLAPLSFDKANAQTDTPIVNTADTTKSRNSKDADHFQVGKVAARSSFTITGKVVAKDDGLPIPGATVKIKGTNTVVLTNAAGKFTIDVPAHGGVLIASFIGYETQQTPMTNSTNKTLDVVLQMRTASSGGLVIVRKVSQPQSLWRRIKGRFSTHSQLAADSNAVRSPYL